MPASFLSFMLAHSTCFLNWKSRNNWPGAAPPEATPLTYPPLPNSLPPLAICHFRLSVGSASAAALEMESNIIVVRLDYPTTYHPLRLTPAPLYATVDCVGLVANRINVACLACCWPLKANVIESLTPSRGSSTSVHTLKTPVGTQSRRREENRDRERKSEQRPKQTLKKKQKKWCHKVY